LNIDDSATSGATPMSFTHLGNALKEAAIASRTKTDKFIYLLVKQGYRFAYK